MCVFLLALFHKSLLVFKLLVFFICIVPVRVHTLLLFFILNIVPVNIVPVSVFTACFIFRLKHILKVDATCSSWFIQTSDLHIQVNNDNGEVLCSCPEGFSERDSTCVYTANDCQIANGGCSVHATCINFGNQDFTFKYLYNIIELQANVPTKLL